MGVLLPLGKKSRFQQPAVEVRLHRGQEVLHARRVRGSVRADPEQLGQTGRAAGSEQIVKCRKSQIRRDEQGLLLGLGECPRETRSDVTLALAFHRARHEDDPVSVGRKLNRIAVCSVWWASFEITCRSRGGRPNRPRRYGTPASTGRFIRRPSSGHRRHVARACPDRGRSALRGRPTQRTRARRFAAAAA